MTPDDLARVSRELTKALDAITDAAVESMTRVVADLAAADDGPTTGDDAPTTPVDESGGPRCDHMEPGTPCDWDRCEQPERLARGDGGGAQPTPTLDALRAGRPVTWQGPTTDNDRTLRQAIAAVLTAEHYCRAAARIVASPEEHSAAMADVVMPVVLAHIAQPAEGDTYAEARGSAEAAITRVRAVLDGWGPFGTTWLSSSVLVDRIRAALDDAPTTAVTEQPTPNDVAVAAELRSIADAITADREPYPGADANWHNGINHAIKAMRARADWMDHRGDEPTAPPAAGLPPAKPCTKHTGAERERYGCTGPDPQES